MVEFEIARIVKGSVAALATRAVLLQQVCVHLGSCPARPIWLAHPLLDAEEGRGSKSVVRAGRGLICERYLTEQPDFTLHAVNDKPMCARVDAQNELILAANFTSAPHLLSPLRRIFNLDLSHGGRFYALGGSWLNVPNRERKLIRIDGVKMTLMDFSACQPRIAYHAIRQPMTGDPYDLCGFERSHCKTAMLVLLNAKDRRAANRALANKNGFAPDSFDRHSYVTAILDALTDKHRLLYEEGWFFGSGLKLMKKDADIADRVMTDLRNQEILSLPIHDGFMVKNIHVQQLRSAMLEHSDGIPVSKEF